MRVIASVLIIIILAVVTPVFLLITSIQQNIISAQFIKDELDKNQVYQLAFDQLDEQISNIEIPEDFPVTHQEISELVKKVFTPAWLEQNIEIILDGLDAWLNSPGCSNASLVVSLAEPKQSLTRELDAFIEEKLARLEPCPQGQTEEGLCQLAGMSLGEVKTELEKNGINPDLASEFLPDNFDLLNPDLSKITGGTDEDNPDDAAATSEAIQKNMKLVKDYYQLSRRLIWYGWILIGVLVFEFMAINATGGWRRLVHWAGILFFIVGLPTLAMALASAQVVEQAVLPNLTIQSDLPERLTELIPTLIWEGQAAAFKLPQWVGLALTSFGLAGIVWAHWIPPAKKNIGISGLKKLTK